MEITCLLVQILGLVQITIGILSFAGVLVILIVNLKRGEGAEYSIVIFFVLLICCVPVGKCQVADVLAPLDFNLCNTHQTCIQGPP